MHSKFTQLLRLFLYSETDENILHIKCDRNEIFNIDNNNILFWKKCYINYYYQTKEINFILSEEKL